MLIISRHKGQRIVIGDDVEIIVTEISRSGVKFGVVAPPSLTILRGEVRDAVERANREALLSQIADPDALLAPPSAPDEQAPETVSAIPPNPANAEGVQASAKP